jgi:flagellar motor protein MotB
MRFDDNEDDLMGPGADLAMSLSGILIIVVFITVTQMWTASNTAKRSEIPSESLAPTVNADVRQTSIEEKEEQFSALNADLEDAKNKIEEGNGRIRALQAIVFQRGAESKKTTDEIGVLERRLGVLQVELAAKTNELSASLAELGGLQNRAVSAETGRDHEEQLANSSALQYANEKSKRETAEGGLEAEKQRAATLQNQLIAMEARLNDRPPLITISDARFRTFAEASAEISPALSQFLMSTMRELYSLRHRYGTTVIEVIGHTDEVRLGPSKRQLCNLDEDILNVLNGRKDAKSLGPCDNVGLGMARATAVVNELKRLGLSKDFTLLPFSAGAAIDTNETVASGNQAGILLPARRRIEIRLRRPGE